MSDLKIRMSTLSDDQVDAIKHAWLDLRASQEHIDPSVALEKESVKKLEQVFPFLLEEIEDENLTEGKKPTTVQEKTITLELSPDQFEYLEMVFAQYAVVLELDVWASLSANIYLEGNTKNIIEQLHELKDFALSIGLPSRGTWDV